MKITIGTTDGKQREVDVVKSIYYTIAGKRVRFLIHASIHMLGCYSITHAKSGLRVRDYPKYGQEYLGVDFVDVAKKMLKEVIAKAGEEKVKEALIKAGEIF